LSTFYFRKIYFYNFILIFYILFCEYSPPELWVAPTGRARLGACALGREWRSLLLLASWDSCRARAEEVVLLVS